MTTLVAPLQSIIVTAPQGDSVLPLVELDKQKVRTKRRPVQLRAGSKVRNNADCSYGNFGGKLQFTAWELFHAAKKTELCRSFTPAQGQRLGLLFADEHHGRFIWDSVNLRCADGSSWWLEDFSTTTLAGRIGEALAYLTMTKSWGYVYWDRIASVWLRAARLANITHKDMLQVATYTGAITQNSPTPQPDFVFEKADKTVALMEAKGSFVTPGNSSPDVKTPLSHGLDQLDAWGSLISPVPASRIVIGSFIREKSDPFTDPSLILHVDPPVSPRPEVRPVPFPKDLIRRGNYGAWLRHMGFDSAGVALAERRSIQTQPRDLAVITLNGRDFALRIQGWRIDTTRPLSLLQWYPFELFESRWWEYPEILESFGITGVYCVGLEVERLKAVSVALTDLESSSLINLDVGDEGHQEVKAPEGFYGSIMLDGTMIGIVSTRLLGDRIRTETFNL